MPAPPRFNLDLLRKLSKRSPTVMSSTWLNEVQLSRRGFLGLSAAAGAGAVIPPLLRGDGFSVLQEGFAIHVLVRDECRWTIDPANFGARARTELSRYDGKVKLLLVDAFFPGTAIPASMEVLLFKQAGDWIMSMEMACGIRVKAPLLAWLDSQISAQGHWQSGVLRPDRAFNVTFREIPQVLFTPEWVFDVIGAASASVEGLAKPLLANALRIYLNPQQQLCQGPTLARTHFQLQRGNHAWNVNLGRESEHGWSLSHDRQKNLFDELTVESAQSSSGSVHTALFRQNEANSASFRLFPGGGLVADSGEPYHLSLLNPRLAFALSDSPVSSALVAEVNSEATWAHGDYASYSISGAPSAPHFELFDDGDSNAVPQVSPGITDIYFPDDNTAMNLKFNVPRPFRFTWADLAAPFERLWGIFHFLPSQHALDVDFDDNVTADHLLKIERPTDLLSLGFHFKNMRLCTGLAPHIEVRDKTKLAQIYVIFPPQHVAEEAFFHTDDNVGDPNQQIQLKVPIGDYEVRQTLGLPDGAVVTTALMDEAAAILDPETSGVITGKNKDGPLPRTLLSGESRIVFNIKNKKTKIPFHLEDLLEWKHWEPVVADVAHTGVPTDNFDNLPAIAEPTNITAIELPYKLILSPSELGRWVHSLKPTSNGTNVVELWHTRLAVAAKAEAAGAAPLAPDESNSADRTVRAIWSPDFVPVDRSITVDAAKSVPRTDANPSAPGFPVHYSSDPAVQTFDDPFRMTLDSLDRCELVHLTSNYRIPTRNYASVAKPTNQQLQSPAPINVERMMLTSIGGYLKSLGTWDPLKVDANHQLTVEQWRHVATLGRDHYVRVVYKGYLLPFGHPASLVKVTERKIVVNKDYPQNGFVAILHQRMFIVVQHPLKDFPVFGQPFGGRKLPFKRIEILTLITPDIDEPKGPFPVNPTHPAWNRSQSQSLFWPSVNGQSYPFRFRFTDLAGTVSEASLPVVFADAAVSQRSVNFNPPITQYGPQDAIDLYNGGTLAGATRDDARTTASFNNQKVAFAAPTKPGDTQYDADILAFHVIPPPPEQDVLDLYKRDLPYFYPEMPYARISSSSIKRVTGNTDSTRVIFFPNYIESGFDLQKNRGEVILQVHDEKNLQLAFGRTGSVDKAGGLANPDTVIAGFSRKAGAVGGKPPNVLPGAPVPAIPDATPSLTTYSSGNFNPSDFFGGLTSAKILGAIQLSDIIAPLAPGLADNLAKAPQMLEQSLFEIESVIGGITAAITTLQTSHINDEHGQPLPNPIAQHLAPQALQVATLDAARLLARFRTKGDADGSLALLADTVAEANLDRQLVGAITDYATALEAVLSNPAALAEEVLISLFTKSLSDAITSANLQLESQFTALIEALQNDLQITTAPTQKNALTTANEALSEFAKAAANQFLADELTNLRNSISFPDAPKASLLFNQYAPDLIAVCDGINAAKDLQTRIGNLVGKPGLGAIPSFFNQLNGILDDLLQIYQSAGFLGIVAVNQSVVDEIKAAEDDIAGIWQQVNHIAALINSTTAAIDAKIQALEDTCLKLAAKAQADSAKKVLQNLRQVQSAVASIAGYSKQIVLWKQTPTQLSPQATRRLIQLVQQLQRQILSSLAALQSMVRLPATELVDAATAARVSLTTFEAQVTDLATLLTAADGLIGTPGLPGPLETRIVNSFVKPAVGDLLAGPLLAKTSIIQSQLSTLSATLATPADSLNLGLKLLHYDLSLQLQSSFAAGLQWRLFNLVNMVSPELKAALDGFAKINGLANAVAANIASVIGTTLCPLAKFWHDFLADLQADTVKLPFYNLFRASLEGVATALNTLCSDLKPPPSPQIPTPLPRPSVLISDARNVFNAFHALFTDISSRISGLSALPKLLLDQAVAIGQQQLVLLLAQIPIPKSVTLSYDWHPTLKPFEPVFLLDDGADFAVSARAQLSLPGGPPPSVDIDATLSKFSINLIGSPSFIIIDFESLTFTSHNGSSPDCRVKINNVTFGEDMSFVKSLAQALNPSEGPFIELSDGAIKAGYRFSLDQLLSESDPGGMTVMGLNIEVAVALPFDGDPVRAEFGLADQQHPFLLAFGIYGGGGFLQLQLGLDGVQLLQGALEFGLVSSITIGPLQGDGFIVAGIYFRIAGSQSCVCGFVHAHGHMDIFGIISLDVDLYVSICYDSGVVRGTATFSVQVSILFFSESFSLQAAYSFGGSSGGANVAMLDPYTAAPWHDSNEPSTAFLVSPDALGPQSPQPSLPEPVFIEDEAWEAYINAFDI